MKKIIVYCHGYGSSPNSSKVERLMQEPDFDVYAYPASVDPYIAIETVSHNIDKMLLEKDLELSSELIIVGTSLGAWLAAKLATLYKCHAVIINPAVDPCTTLEKYGVPLEIREKYSIFAPAMNHTYFFAGYDEVIDNREFRRNLLAAGYHVEVVHGADHRFGGQAFEHVIKHLKRQSK